MEQNEPYQTPDLGLASSLLASGIPFLGTSGESGRQLQFRFEESKRIREIEVAYHSGQLKIEALSFIAAYRRLKAVIARQRGRRDG